ncbi:MAG: hypothetical protein CM1200mP14_03240 [Gammaproteobacteria bacterium]|nr:MAG: hypothetical protein CM1200mP14_03240 [Gammaproteobacteria bacterium]
MPQGCLYLRTVVGLRTNEGDVGADAVVLATGPFSADILGEVGIQLPLSPARATIATTPQGLVALPRSSFRVNSVRLPCFVHQWEILSVLPVQWSFQDLIGDAHPEARSVDECCSKMLSCVRR